MTPVERVARAIVAASWMLPWDELGNIGQGSVIKIARAAISALEEPSEAMVAALHEHPAKEGQIRYTWATMIRAALEEKP